MKAFGIYVFLAIVQFIGLITWIVMIIGKGSVVALDIIMLVNCIIVMAFFIISAIQNKRKQNADTENKTD